MPKRFQCALCHTEYETSAQARSCRKLRKLGGHFSVGTKVISISDQSIHTLTGFYFKRKGGDKNPYHLCFYMIDPPVIYHMNKRSKVISGAALLFQYKEYAEERS